MAVAVVAMVNQSGYQLEALIDWFCALTQYHCRILSFMHAAAKSGYDNETSSDQCPIPDSNGEESDVSRPILQRSKFTNLTEHFTIS